MIKLQQLEYHQVHLYKTYEITEEDFNEYIEGTKDDDDHFKGTWEEFQELDADEMGEYVSWSDGWIEPSDTDEDWWSDRKGGYDIEYEFLEVDEDEEKESVEKPTKESVSKTENIVADKLDELLAAFDE